MTAISQQYTRQPAIDNKAALWTIAVHAILLLLFFLVSWTLAPTPMETPLNDTLGMEVNLGTSDDGSGNDQPMAKKKPSAYQATVVYKSVATTTDLPKEIIQSTDADAPVVDNTRTKTNTPIPTPAENNKPSPKPAEKPKYTYQGETGPGGNDAKHDAPGTGEGNTHGNGDRGVPGGTPGATNYIGHNLVDREITPKKFEAEFSESGKVVIHVTVDRNGNIINKRVKSSSSPQLTQLALDKINSAKFSPGKGAAPEQSGDVTFTFKTRQ